MPQIMLIAIVESVEHCFDKLQRFQLVLVVKDFDIQSRAHNILESLVEKHTKLLDSQRSCASHKHIAHQQP